MGGRITDEMNRAHNDRVNFYRPTMNTATATAIATATAAVLAAEPAIRCRWDGSTISYTYLPTPGSIVKTHGPQADTPALRGAIAWAMRRGGRQIVFRGGRVIGFD